MFDTLKKSVLTGIGLALRSKNEIEELAKEFAQKSEMGQEEAKAFLKECQDKYEEAKEGFDQKLEKAIEKVLAKLDMPSRSDVLKLSDRIEKLEKKLTEKK